MTKLSGTGINGGSPETRPTKRTRIIPVMLWMNGGFYKTVKFASPRYIGDPTNTLRIFNDKQVDELVVLDIAAARERTPPDLRALAALAGECFMPLSYGGGIATPDTVREILALGFEKVIVNSGAWTDRALLPRLAGEFGTSTVVASIDFSRGLLGRTHVCIYGGRKRVSISPEEWAVELEAMGAGEILLTDMDRDGVMMGYNLDVLRRVKASVSIPVITSGGAGNLSHLQDAAPSCDGLAAGSMFVYQGIHRAVLVTYPTEEERCRSGL
jgi:cyclase